MCAATSQMVAKVAELMELRKMIEDLNAVVGVQALYFTENLRLSTRFM